MSRLSKIVLPLIAVLALAACEDPDVYPVSGEPCDPNDPVQSLDARDCVPPVGVNPG